MITRVLVLALVPALVSCQMDSGTRRPDGYAADRRPIPRPEPVTTSLKRVDAPTRVAVIVSSVTRDTNADGFGDRVEVSALLFDDNSPDPVFADGTFAFELVEVEADGGDGSPLGTWVFGPDAGRKAEGPTMFGLPGYRFELDLGEAAKGMQPASANLLTGFQPANGAPAIMPTQDQRLVRVGPVG